MRLRGKGEPASGRGSRRPDAHGPRPPHPFFARKGNDLLLRLPITLGKAVAGPSVDVPTPSGTVALHVPPGTSAARSCGSRAWRRANSGVKGDLLAEVLIVLPANLTEEDRETIRQIDARCPTNPRQALRW